MINYGKQAIDQKDIEAVIDCLTSDYLTQGPLVPKFEENIANYCGAKHAVAVNSATSALHIACLALGVCENDIVWTVANTFVATANCARYCGATVKFIDIEPETGNLSLSALSESLKNAKLNNELPKVIIPVHFAGQPCDMKALSLLADEYGFSVIEDASHALGSVYQGSKTGSCQFSDICIFSFHPVKIITTAEGGMAVTNDGKLASKMRLLSSHGITKDPSEFQTNQAEPWYYEQQCLGFNYRMSELHAALGISQLAKLDDFISRRNEIANFYIKLFKAHDIEFLIVKEGNLSSYHLFCIQVAPEMRRDIFNELRKIGIGVQVHYIPVNRQPFHDSGEYTENADKHCARSISIPIYPSITKSELEYVSNSIISILDKYKLKG